MPEYPEGIIFDIESKGVKITALDALSLAEQAGTAKAVNLVLLGVCAKNTDIEKDVWTRPSRPPFPKNSFRSISKPLIWAIITNRS